MTKPLAEEKKAPGGEVRQLMVKEVENHLRGSCLFVAQYRGLSAAALEDLRRKLRPLSSRYVVAKNNLSCIALKQLGLEALIPFVTGQTGFVVGGDDPVTLSKTVVGYTKDHEALKLTGGLVEGEVVSAERLQEFAKLPTREVLYGKTVFLIQSPLSGLAGVLSGTIRKLLYALQEIAKKHGKGGGTE